MLHHATRDCDARNEEVASDNENILVVLPSYPRGYHFITSSFSVDIRVHTRRSVLAFNPLGAQADITRPHHLSQSRVVNAMASPYKRYPALRRLNKHARTAPTTEHVSL